MTAKLRVTRRPRNSIALGVVLLVAALATGVLLAVVLLAAASAAKAAEAPDGAFALPAHAAFHHGGDTGADDTATAQTTTTASGTSTTANATTTRRAATTRTTRTTKATTTNRAVTTPASAGRTGTRAETPMTLQGGQEGTAFRTLTVEGEDRVHVEFDRPSLDVNLDPTRAPGLELGSAGSVLERTMPDLKAPFVNASADDRSPYTARPWLNQFQSGPLARFRPTVTDVARWKLLVANSGGETVATYSGNGRPPAELTWDGRGANGEYATPGVTYSYVLEAFDKAGNKRNFVGQGFQVPPYRVTTSTGTLMTFSGGELTGATATAYSVDRDREATSPIVMEAANWLNQTTRPSQPVKVTAIARHNDQADALATTVASGLARYTMGDAGRIRTVAMVEPDAPAEGVIRITPAR